MSPPKAYRCPRCGAKATMLVSMKIAPSGPSAEGQFACPLACGEPSVPIGLTLDYGMPLPADDQPAAVERWYSNTTVQ